MEPQDADHLDRMLVDCLRSYVRVCESGTDDEQVKGLRNVCSTLARFLGRLLESDERWNRYWWVDDVSPTSATLLPGHQLRLQGLMIWGQKGSSKEWVEPCSMVLSETAGVIKYRIQCGDALRGLGKATYEHRSQVMNQTPPENWVFVFSK
jgi:hypothetical protein